MKKLFLVTLMALFYSAIMIGQVTWTATSDGLWSDAANWSPSAVPTDADEVRLGVPAICTVDADAVFGRLRLGYNGDAEMIVKSNVTMTGSATDWSSLGENAKGTLTVEADAVLDLGNHHNYISQNGGDSEIEIYGIIKNSSSLRLAEKGGIANVTIYTGGSLITRYISDINRWGEGAHMDIRGGTFKCTQIEGEVATFIEQGKIVAYGGGGKIIYEETDGNTIVTSEEDPSAPTIESSIPFDTETGYPGASPIIITFSKWMDRASVEAVLTVSPSIVNQTLTWAQNTLTISGDAMTDLTTYTVTIGAGATDVNGIAAAGPLSFSFTTIDPNAPPVIVTTSPLDAATDINEGSPIEVIFSKSMDSTSVAAAVTVVPALVNASSSWSNEYKTLSIAHDNAPWNQVYTVTVAAGAEASADATALEADYTFSFTVRGMPQTTNVWNPAANDTPDGLWMTAANWTQGVVPDDPSYNYKVVFNVPGAAAAILDDSVNINCLRLGDGGPGDTLIIKDKGYLKTNGDWNGFGYNGDTSVVIIEAGGTLDLSSHAWIGYHNESLGKIDVYGKMFIKGSTGLNWADDGGTGILTIHDGGVLDMRSLNEYSESGKNSASINAGSVIDVDGGEWIINRHDGQKAIAKQYIEAGRITAYGGDGIVRVVEDSTVTDTDTTYYTLITSTMVANTDATLSAITSDVGGVFKPAFDPAVTTYDLIVPFGSFWANLSGVPTDKYASVSPEVFVDLSLGSGQAVVTCTAEDGSTKAYTVNVTVAEVSTPTVQALKENAYYIPSLDIVRVENAASVEMISVFDITGKLRFNTNIRNTETFDIDASALKHGLYIIQLKSTDNSRKSYKFIK
jgi:hypothetical protein